MIHYNFGAKIALFVELWELKELKGVKGSHFSLLFRNFVGEI